MFECHVCGNKIDRTELVSEVFDIEGRRVLVERIPARVCARCGEAVFSPEIVEKIRMLVHSETHPIKTVSMDVFDLV
jgi:HTH-type transcriptional regulator / antitoxin MqsA